MKKQLWILVFLMSLVQLSNAQANNINTTGKFGSQIFLSDVYGRAFENKYGDINGSAYFLPDYKFSTIILSDGRKYSNVKAKLNLVEHEVVFKSTSGEEGFIGKGMVSTISIVDSTKQGIKNYTFQSGFPKIDNQTSLYFYQVYTTGKVALLKSINKSIEERLNELSGEKSKEFMVRENGYIYMGGEMKRIKKEKEFFMNILADQAGPVNQYLIANKINFKNDDQIVKLIEFYNSL
jgi:hypothetical protein